MVYPASMLIHSASLETGESLGTADIAGIKPSTKTYTTISCRFDIPKPDYKRQGDAGYHTTRTPQCIIAATVAAVEGKRLVGITAPYNRTYIIKSVNPATIARTISHYVLYLEAVDNV